MKVHLITFGCKANQADTERFRQALISRGATITEDVSRADICLLNTCTVTNQADAEARRAIRRLKREHPSMEIVVAGCSAALQFDVYQAMEQVTGVARGHDVEEVVGLIAPAHLSPEQDEEPIGAALLQRDTRGTRAFMKIQDGCDRRCSFCATRLARGVSRSRHPDELVQEAQQLAAHHPEIVLTGVHIGHYGYDLREEGHKVHTLSRLVAKLLEAAPEVRWRVGSVEATELDDLMVELLEQSGGRVVPHLHVPMQSGADPVLRRMKRWHSREQYRSRMLEIASRMSYLGLGADIITGFPGETEEDHAQTMALVEELPFTYLHVFPYSVRDGTLAASYTDRVPGDVSAARSRELRELAHEKGLRYRRQRAGQAAELVVEEGGYALTEDYLRVRLEGDAERYRATRHYAPLKLDERGELFAVLHTP